jgi:hypothetical protein
LVYALAQVFLPLLTGFGIYDKQHLPGAQDIGPETLWLHRMCVFHAIWW